MKQPKTLCGRRLWQRRYKLLKTRRLGPSWIYLLGKKPLVANGLIVSSTGLMAPLKDTKPD